MAGVVASKVRKQRANLQELSKAAGIPSTQPPLGGGGRDVLKNLERIRSKVTYEETYPSLFLSS
jgi:hypothetical protein